jgi:hypothetical protein
MSSLPMANGSPTAFDRRMASAWAIREGLATTFPKFAIAVCS